MAEVLAQIQDEYLTCQICQCQFDRPKALPCLHTFCERCLREFVFSRSYDQVGRFPCPCCRQEIRLPRGGVDSFPYNHLVVSLLDTVSAGQMGDGGTEATQETIPKVEPRPAVPVSDDQLSAVPAVEEPMVTDAQSMAPQPPQSQSQPPPPPPPPRPERPASAPRPRASPPDPPLVPVSYNRHSGVLSFGKFGQDFTDFCKPVGLAVSDNYIVVSDQHNNRIFIFDWNGRLKSLFTCAGQVHDIAMAHSGHLVVANSKAGHALAIRYNLNGQRLAAIGNMFEFEKPHGVAILNKNDDIVATAVETNTVFVLGDGGKLVQKFASRCSGIRYVAITNDQDIVVSSSESHCVKIFDRFGKNIAKIGSEGSRAFELKHPMGVCVDQHDNIVVADSGNQRVQVLSPSGEYIDTVVDLRNDNVRNTPVNVALNAHNNKLVVLIAGPNYAKVRVYPYKCRHRKPTVSAVCACQ